MNTLPDFSAIIFDMDGLVLDTETTYSIAWKKAAVEMGQVFSEAFCLSMSGLQGQDVARKLIEQCGSDFDLMRFGQLSGQYWRQYVNDKGIAVKKGFLALLHVLKSNKIPYCLATNSRMVNALECLKLAGLDDVFSLIVSKDQVNQGKPAADIFLFAANALKVPVAECLVIEDSATGIQAAMNAVAPCVFIPSVLPYDAVAAQQADILLNDLDELAEIVLSAYIHPV